MQRTNSYRKTNDKTIATVLKKKIQSMITPSIRYQNHNLPHYPKPNHHRDKENNPSLINVDQISSKNISAICKTSISQQPTCNNHPENSASFCCWLDSINISFFCQDCAIEGVQKNYRLLRLNNNRFELLSVYQKQKQQISGWERVAHLQLKRRVSQLQQSIKKYYQKLLENVHQIEKNTIQILQMNISNVSDLFNNEKNLFKISKIALEDKQHIQQQFNIAELCRINRESVQGTIDVKKTHKTAKRQTQQFNTFDRKSSKQKLNYFQKKIIKMSKKKNQNKEKNNSMDFSSIVIE